MRTTTNPIRRAIFLGTTVVGLTLGSAGVASAVSASNAAHAPARSAAMHTTASESPVVDELNGANCNDGIDAATGASCDGGQAANPTSGTTDGTEG